MNENCNGMLRRFISKGTGLEKVSSKKLEEIFKKNKWKTKKNIRICISK